MNASQHTPKLTLEFSASARRHSNLALALLLLPRQRRKDAFLFYDFCRTVDNIADTGTLSPDQRKEMLDAWIAAFQRANERNLPDDFAAMIVRRELDRRLLSEIVLGMQMDVVHEGEILRYQTFDDLRLYCWRVASAVGLVSASIFGASGDTLKDYAEHLGIALQITNILRDVAEDAAMHRIYIPQEDLTRFCVAEEQILSLTSSPQVTHLLNHQAERADSYFAKAELAWSKMSPNQRRMMRPARVMSAIYRQLLLQMHSDRYDIFNKRYHVSSVAKLFTLITILLQPTRQAYTKNLFDCYD